MPPTKPEKSFHIPLPDFGNSNLFPHVLTLILVTLFGLEMLKLEPMNYNIPLAFLKSSFQLTLTLESALMVGVGIILIEKFLGGKSIFVSIITGAGLYYLLGTPAYTKIVALIAAGIVLSKYAKKEGLLDQKDLSKGSESYSAKDTAAEFKQKKAVGIEADSEKPEKKK